MRNWEVMPETPCVSIVTISFNQRRYLERAIQSVIDQAYPAFEFIVVDPGSVDGSRQIIDCYRGRITRCVLAPDNGPAQGLNHGFSYATGAIYGFINADDILLPGAVDHVAEYFRRNPDIDVLLGCGIWIDENGKTLKHVVPSRFSTEAAAVGRFEFIQQSTFFRRIAFDRCGGFNELNHICWDGELLFDFARMGMKFGRSPRELGAFRLYAGTITDSDGYLERLRREEARIYCEIANSNSPHMLRLKSYIWLVRKWLLDPWYVWMRLARGLLRP